MKGVWLEPCADIGEEIMMILIAGLAKTGTTGLLYLIANSMGEDAKPRLLFEPKKCPADLKAGGGNVLAKVLTGSKLNVPSFAHFDRKIAIVRDPRDRMVSALLYSQYHANYLTDTDKVRIVRENLEKKEADPSGMSIREILEVIGEVNGKRDMVGFFLERIEKSLGRFDNYIAAMPDSLLYKYEDFVSGVYTPLEQHLGLSITGAAVVPDKLNRVVRTKGFGDWRNWFTKGDVQELRPLFAPWLEKYQYDPDDWALNEVPVIKPEHCSEYFTRLVLER